MNKKALEICLLFSIKMNFCFHDILKSKVSLRRKKRQNILVPHAGYQMGAVVFFRFCCLIADLSEMRRENSKQNHLCAQMFDQSDELQGMKLKFPHLQIQLHLRQGSQSMSNDSASSIIIKDSKLQSMTNFPLRSAFEFPVSSQSQRVMCAKKEGIW